MKIKSKLVLILCVSVLCSALSGCSAATVLEKNKEIEQKDEQINNLQDEIAQLRVDIKNLSVTEVSPETSLKEVEGTEVPVFETIDGKIKFPNTLQLPNSKFDVNNSYVMVGSRFRFNPSNNWLMRLKGTSLEFSHPSKLWGTIKAVSITEPMPFESMQPLLQNFFNGFPATTITYRKVFIEDAISGLIAKANLTVDGKPHVVNVGFVQRGEFAVLILFDFEDDNSGVQQELIDLLISSGTFGESKLKLE